MFGLTQIQLGRIDSQVFPFIRKVCYLCIHVKVVCLRTVLVEFEEEGGRGGKELKRVRSCHFTWASVWLTREP